MSTRVTTWVFDHSPATGNDRLVLFAIADEADDDGTNAYPSVDRIARKARVPKRTTLRCLQRLEEAGQLIVNRPATKGRGHFNTYVVVMRNDATVAPTETARNGVTDDEKRRVTARSATQSVLDPLTQDPQTQGHTDVAILTAAFEDFWQAYPRHTAKGEARKAWPVAVKAAGGCGRIIAGARAFASDPNRDPRYTPHPATWLRAERWGDDPLPPRGQPNGKGPTPRPIMDDRTVASGRIEL